MKLLILGAGASVAHSDKVPCPPLTKDLLPILARSYTTWGTPGIEELARKHGNNVEAIMDELLRFPQTLNNTYALNQALGWFFLQFGPDKDSLYVKLLRGIDPSELVICTPNYDVILQATAAAMKRELYVTGFEFSDYSVVEKSERPDAIELLLPHGSAGLVETESRVWNNSFHGAAMDFQITHAAAPKMCVSPDLERYYSQNELNPIMSYIHVGKRATLGSRNLEVVQRRFAEVCETCDRIAIVGMQLNIKDKHILRPLMNSTAPMMLSVGKDIGLYRGFGSRVTDTGKYWRDSFDSILEFLNKR